ncbi:MAG: hypothetical protein K6F48_12865 [Paludibacteraceae bacterium]|nr:hypothetical protein [Paludibacteraceae bacterium]
MRGALKHILVASVFSCVSMCAMAQGAMIVEDPVAIAQTASNFCEEMANATDQKVTLLEQMKEMLNQSKLMKENAEKYKKCMKWVKNARSVVSLLDKVNHLKDNYKTFYGQLVSCDYLSKAERNNIAYNANLIVKESAEVYEEAKTIIGEFTGEGDAGLTSFERIQLIDKIGERIDALNDKLNVIKYQANQKVDERRRTINYTLSLYNQYTSSAYRLEYKTGDKK